MAKLLSLLPLTGLVFLSLTTAPSSCQFVVLNSHLHSLVRREVKSDGAGGPGDVVNDVGDQKVYDAQKNNGTDEFKELVASDLSDNELQALMIVEDTKFGAEADEHAGLKLLRDVRQGTKQTTSTPARRRRQIGRAIFSAGRALLRSFSRNPATKSGSRVTQHYSKPGNYRDAVRDFQSLRPTDVKSINRPGLTGQTGKIGNHKVTVRDYSKEGSPTMEIRSHGGDLVRKFRYENPK